MKNIRFGIVGTNFISDWFVMASKLVCGVEISAVYSRKFDTGETFAQKHNIARVYTDCKEMFASNIDAVYVASPTICHKDHSILAMEAGKHVLCEKMIAASYSDFCEMKSAAHQFSVVLLEAMRPLFDPAYDLVRRILSELGRPRFASLEYLQYSSRYDKFKAGIVENAFKPEMKNSALADIGIYPLNTCISLFGKPESISASSTFLENGFEGEGIATLDYGDFSADVVYSKIRNGERPSVIKCEHGDLFIDKISAPSVLTVVKNGETEQIKLPSPEYNLNMQYEIAAFRDMLGGERRHAPYLDHTEAVMRCVDSIYRSVGIDF